MQSTYDTLFEYIKELEIIDTHEHLPYYEKNRNRDTDILCEYLGTYFNVDLISSGLSQSDFDKVINPQIDIKERFKIVKPYWEVSKFTGYGRCLTNTVKLVYGIDDINEDTVEILNEKFKKTLNTDGHYQRVLKDISKIKITILDGIVDCDDRYFKPSIRLDDFIMLNIKAVEQLEKLVNIKICDFEDYLQAVSLYIEKLSISGVNILKCGLAYTRPLYFPITSRNEAEQEFIKIKSANNSQYTLASNQTAGASLQNYMMHYVLKNAQKYNMVYQFHTGLLEGNGNFIANSNPTHMNNLFALYPNIKFDIFHIGYPYMSEMGALVKMFPNVYINMCWAHIISPVASINILGEWLEFLPYNKICAFGGDFGFIDGVAGHQFMARQNVAKALSMKIKENVFDIDTARNIAENLFYDNPKNLYSISD